MQKAQPNETVRRVSRKKVFGCCVSRAQLRCCTVSFVEGKEAQKIKKKDITQANREYACRSERRRRLPWCQREPSQRNAVCHRCCRTGLGRRTRGRLSSKVSHPRSTLEHIHISLLLGRRRRIRRACGRPLRRRSRVGRRAR
jgi:hypothetical protein